jgi:pimeloyl-ACP methyl ester carboxylesterase
VRDTFHPLLDSMLSEISRREPAYARRFPLAVPSFSRVAERYLDAEGACAGLTAASRARVLEQGFRHVALAWPSAASGTADGDPVSSLLCDSMIDASAAGAGLRPYADGGAGEAAVEEILRAQYIERSAAGTRYYARRTGKRPLLVVNATGTPVDTWRRMLADRELDFRILLPENQSGGLFGGGLEWIEDIQAGADKLASVLEKEGGGAVDVVAWCNGARVAIDLAIRRPDLIASLVLLTPMLKGVRGVAPDPSPFERDLEPILEAVGRRAELAPFLAKTIAAQALAPEWRRLEHDPAARAAALFALPPRDQALRLLEPLTSPGSLVTLAKRNVADETYAMDEALGQLSLPTLVILGANDRIVSNAVTLAAVRAWARSVFVATVSGAGHYIHDLQYHYFRFLLEGFAQHRTAPSPMARVRVEIAGRLALRSNGRSAEALRQEV